MVSACQAGTDGPSSNGVRRTGSGTIQNGHALKANEENGWRGGKDVDCAHSAPPSGVQQVDEQKQQHQGPVIRWERFLPVKTLRVLLVENDDCTRHIVGALLRKCGYEGMPCNLQLQDELNCLPGLSYLVL
jgi:pseudo-response regulator 7